MSTGGGYGSGRDYQQQSEHAPFISYTPAPGDELLICPYDSSHRIRSTKLETHLLKCRRNHMDARRAGSISGPEEIEICPYNSTHHILSKDLDKHKKSCPQAPKTTTWSSYPTSAPGLGRGRGRLGQPQQQQNLKPLPDNEKWQVTGEPVHETMRYFGSSRKYPSTTTSGSSVAVAVGRGMVIKKEVVGEEDWEEECKFNDHTKPSYDPIKKIKTDARLSYIEPGLSKTQRRRKLEEEDERIQLARCPPQPEPQPDTKRHWGGGGRGRVGDVDPFSSLRRIRNDPTCRNSLRNYTEVGKSMDVIQEVQGENNSEEHKKEKIEVVGSSMDDVVVKKEDLNEGDSDDVLQRVVDSEFDGKGDEMIEYNQISSINFVNFDYD